MSKTFKEAVLEHNKKEAERYGFKSVEDYDKVIVYLCSIHGFVLHSSEILRVKEEMGL